MMIDGWQKLRNRMGNKSLISPESPEGKQGIGKNERGGSKPGMIIEGGWRWRQLTAEKLKWFSSILYGLV